MAAEHTERVLWEELRSLAADLGIEHLGVCPADVLEPARPVLHLRKEAGRAGSMQFTYRNPDRSSEPTRSLGSARSILVAAWPYARRRPHHESGPASPSSASRPPGRVATYAWHDHYADLRAALDPLADHLRAAGHDAAVHLDDNHLVDRNVAWRAGLGWYGKNANLLVPGRGSWVVVGSVLTSADLPDTGPPVVDGCGPCRQCIDACPTDAIVAPGVVDARRCIAWLVQGPGPIPEEFRVAVGDRLYGCDDCQEVCPPNQRDDPEATRPPAEPDADPAIDPVWILDADDATLMARVGRWYIADRDPDIVRRTALVVLGNTGSAHDPDTVRILRHHADSPSPLLAEHARWAADRLGIDVVGAS